MAKKMKAAILGFGGIGHCHAGNYSLLKNCELVAVADTAPEQMAQEKMAVNFGENQKFDLKKLHKYNSFEELVRKEKELDFIDICLPTDLHAEYAIKALKAGINVLSEKPMARNLAQCDKMIAAAKAAGKQLMIGQCVRFDPNFAELKKIYDSGKYGKLLKYSARRISGLPTGYQKWFRDGRRSGGALLDMHIHDTDFIRHMLGMPAKVMTYGCTHFTGFIDDAITSYIYPDGPVVTAETSWSAVCAFTESFEAVFEKATIAQNEKGELWMKQLDKPAKQINVKKTFKGTSHGLEIEYFADCLAKGKKIAKNTPESCRETIRLALAEERSAKTGKAVSL